MTDEELAAARARAEAAAEAEVARHNDEVRARMARQTRRSFIVGGAAAVAGFGAFEWITSRRLEDGIPWPMRLSMAANEELTREYFTQRHLAPDFTGKVQPQDRINSDIGLENELDAAAWRLKLYGVSGQPDGNELSIADLRALPRTSMTTEFKCVEGWSAVMQWSGVRFSDFAAKFPPETAMPWVNLETPDQRYYVGMELESMMHPQTLLAYEINGHPLPDEHGAPLRLVSPLKYGLKQIKRIGAIRYQTVRPADYWYERGYDYYVGL